MIKRIFILCGLYGVLFLFSCSGGSDDAQPLEPKLSVIQKKIFNEHCAISGCHTGSRPESQLNLESDVSFENLVNVKSVQIQELYRVAPGKPDSSYLLNKVEGGGIVGEVMPNNQTKLTAGEIEIIRQWISQGAPDN